MSFHPKVLLRNGIFHRHLPGGGFETNFKFALFRKFLTRKVKFFSRFSLGTTLILASKNLNSVQIVNFSHVTCFSFLLMYICTLFSGNAILNATFTLIGISTSNHLAKRPIWDKSPKFTSGILESPERSETQDVNEGDLSKIAQFAR